MEAAGLEDRILPTDEEEKYRKNLFLGMPETMNFSKVRIPLSKYGTAAAIDALFIKIKELNIDDATVFRDEQPLLETYNLLAASIWREEYTKHYTKMFTEKGIPLFD